MKIKRIRFYKKNVNRDKTYKDLKNSKIYYIK